MRALFTRPQLYRSSFYQCTRTLRTRPRRLPTHTTPWNPSTHTQIPDYQPGTESEAAAVQHDVFDYAAFKHRREEAREAKGLKEDPERGRQLAIQRLDDYITRASARNPSAHTPRLRALLWRAYSSAKEHDPVILSRLSRRDWDILWGSASIRLRPNRYARAQVEELYSGMVSTGITPRVQERIAYMDSMFGNGKEKEALQEWKACCGNTKFLEHLRDDPALVEIGIRMHAYSGRLGPARRLLKKLFEAHPAWDWTIMMAVFRAHLRSESEDQHKKGWEIYRRMKTTFGERLTLKDYDSCFVACLEARNLPYAEQVFGDMVKNGHLAFDFSEDQVDQVLRKLHLLYRLATDIAKATGIALHSITILPKEYHPRVFEDWMKHAVALSAPEAAAQILDMMFNRGCEPSTIHFNLLLKALFRAKDKSYELKAENIGWHMLEASDAAHKSTPKKASSSSAHDPLLRRVPPANAATLALLMSHHAKHHQWEHVQYLDRRMKELGLRPNELIMNALMDLECQKGNYNAAWELYYFLTKIEGEGLNVFPNGASIRCLWKTLRLALGDHAARQKSTLPGPRELLAETIRWSDSVRSRHDADQFRMGLAAKDQGALEALVMHCFSYTKDLAGSLVAMHALRDRLDISPTPKALQILLKQISWVDLRKHSHEVPKGQHGLSEAFKAKVEQMERIHQILLDARLKRKGIDEFNYEHMSEDQTSQLNLEALSEFIRVILKRQHPPEVVESIIDQAKMDIGLPDLATGDLDAFGVA